jgi:hypothetical protein
MLTIGVYRWYTTMVHRRIRIIGTLLVVALLTAPWWAPQWGPGLLGEIAVVAFPGNLLIVGGFLALVALYCRTLQATMSRAGAARSASVWWMFAIPANFVEDFYIVNRVGAALDPLVERPALNRWLLLGHAWCALQLLSLLPGVVGLTGGALAIAAWLAHWVSTLSILRRLP